MTWADLPPAGNAIVLRDGKHPLPSFPGYTAVWVNSGTAALALAMLATRFERPEISHPEVVLPGYACPDLVSAALYAGLKPVVVDIEHEDPGYDLVALRAVLNPATIAVVAINFLGIKERLREIRDELAIHPRIALIEDNAQWFPEPQDASVLEGDYVCLSFGRGKPVSLLGGGALLIRNERFESAYRQLKIGRAQSAGASFALQAKAYNFLLHSIVYGTVSRNPLLKLGQTAFKRLTHVHALDQVRLALLGTNLDAHIHRSRDHENQLHSLLTSKQKLLDLPWITGPRRGRLLRYPILCATSIQRDRYLVQLRRAGLGASAMYQRPLPKIDGMSALVKVAGQLPNSLQFAGRFLTLPIHSGVTKRHLAQIASILETH